MPSRRKEQRAKSTVQNTASAGSERAEAGVPGAKALRYQYEVTDTNIPGLQRGKHLMNYDYMGQQYTKVFPNERRDEDPFYVTAKFIRHMLRTD